MTSALLGNSAGSRRPSAGAGSANASQSQEPRRCFSTAETARHARVIEFAATLKQAAAEHRAARAKCKSLGAAQKQACYASVREQARRGFGAHQS